MNLDNKNMTVQAFDWFKAGEGIFNIHANCIAIGEYGILVTGKSGVGKTQLCFELLERSRILMSSRRALWVSDDRTLLKQSWFVQGQNVVWVANPASELAGLAEMRFLGPVSVAHANEIPCTHWLHIDTQQMEVDRVQQSCQSAHFPFGRAVIELEYLRVPALEITHLARLVEHWLVL